MRRLPVYLLVALLVTWGTCPCVFARMLGIGADGTATQATDGRAAPAAPC